jgi:hypothetical protein
VTSTIPATVRQINPKNVTYEAFGTLGQWRQRHIRGSQQLASRSHPDVAAWSVSETTMSPSVTLSLVMQVDGDAAGHHQG